MRTIAVVVFCAWICACSQGSATPKADASYMVKQIALGDEIRALCPVIDACMPAQQQEIIALCDKYIRLDPVFFDAYTTKAGALALLGRVDEAYEFISAAFRKYPYSPELKLAKTRLEINQKKIVSPESG